MKRLETLADEQWEKDGLTYFLYRHRNSHWCGYVRFPKRPLRERGYGGIASYVPVHGRITFAKEEDRQMTYGFDCAHFGDENRPELKDRAWLRAECERMGKAIQIAAEFESDYLLAETEDRERGVIDAYLARIAAEGIT